jgi:hypothetical protein
MSWNFACHCSGLLEILPQPQVLVGGVGVGGQEAPPSQPDIVYVSPVRPLRM